ncbi:MAG: UDP-N-acetylglucosamine--N-acetylmuramyl-(pentapeptide) pyrophosphoryl-undecaprenol N-acetylglucosamine transferase [Candidatus Bathyarchaeia archaeon]
MKVYVSACGIGNGHMARCDPLISHLMRSGIDVLVSTYSDGYAYALRRGFRTVRALSINYRTKPDGSVDFKRTATSSGFSLGVHRFLKQLVREIEYMKWYKPDVVISDSRASSLIAAKLLGIPCALILNQFRIRIVKAPSNGSLGLSDRIFFLIANLAWIYLGVLLSCIWELADRIFIPDFPPPLTISEGNLRLPRRALRKVEFVGPMVRLEDGNERDRILRELGLGEDKPLIYLAVSGPRKERQFLVDKLEDILKSDLMRRSGYQFVMSCGDPLGRSSKRFGNVVIFDWVDDQDALMRASKVVLCRAGHGTIMKCISLGKPMILVPTPDHTEQYGNAEKVERLGLGRVLHQKDLSEVALLSIIEDLVGKRIEFELRGEGDAFSRIIDYINLHRRGEQSPAH